MKLKKKSKEVMEELYLMRHISHHQIASIQRIYKDEDKLYVLSERVEGKNLKFYMDQENRLSEREISYIVQQILDIAKHIIVDGVMQGHNSLPNAGVQNQKWDKTIYRDFRIENFVVDPQTLQVTMIDYGVVSQFLNIGDLKQYLQAPVSVAPE